MSDITLSSAARSASRLGAVFIALAGLLGCNDPCGELRERVCRADSAAACAAMKAIEADPRAGDREACLAGVSFIDELKRGR